jgi:predicted O-methyltransferase YrrM
MNDWTDGYIAEIGYTHGFYRELAPAMMRYALTLAGFDTPSLENFRYCELGFGQGVSANLLAATHASGEFWGTDFNPRHAAGAQQLARQADLANTQWFDESFREFLERYTPPFDFIALHGIYSWVSEENQRLLVEILRRKLKVGGVVYISYNTLPGWSSVLPLRYLLKSHADAMSAPRDAMVDKVKHSLEFVEDMMELRAGYFGGTFGLSDRLKQIRSHDAHYVVHEYLNAHWIPVFFGEMIEALEPAKLTYAASAHVADHLDALCVPSAVSQRLAKIADPIFRETVRDFCRNQQFRRDLFVRGARPLTSAEQRRRLLDMRFALTVPREMVKDTIKTPAGEVNLRPEVYGPILEALAQGPDTIEALLARPPMASLSFENLSEAMTVLVGSGYASPCLGEDEQQDAAASALRFNRAVLESTASGRHDLQYLASPCLGSGIQVGSVQQLFLRHWLQGVRDKEGWARNAWQDLQAQGKSLLKDGQVLATEAENLAELDEWVETFATGQFPVLQRLGVI